MKKPLRYAIAATAIAVLAGTSAYAGAELHPRVVTRVVGPAECHNPTLPSGDSMNVTASGDASTPAEPARDVRQFVCTDGTWVPVSGYGS